MNYIVFDFETNGLRVPQNPDFAPIQFAYVKVVDGHRSEGMTYINAGVQVQEKITELTGVTQEQADSGISIQELRVLLEEIFDGTTGIVGHNAIRFDVPIVEEVIGKEIKKGLCYDTAGQYKGEQLGWKRFRNSNYYKYHMACLETRRRGMKFNLAHCIEQYEIPEIEGTSLHDAMGDVLYTEQIFLKQKKAIDENPENYIRD